MGKYRGKIIGNDFKRSYILKCPICGAESTHIFTPSHLSHYVCRDCGCEMNENDVI